MFDFGNQTFTHMARFPMNFLWGAATSAHQVEGGNRNDWTEFENQSAKRLAQIAASRQSQGKKEWPEYILKNYPNPLQEENYVSGRACDHYNRFREDFDIAKQLGHNAHRFSIEWSRMEPEEGKFDEKEIEHYREVIRALKERGLEPFVGLWHWTLPLWIRDKGGVAARDFPVYFSSYVEKITAAFGSEVHFWITLNEPEIYSFDAYIRGVWPPQKKSPLRFLRVMQNLVRAHRDAYRKIHALQENAMVGIAKNNIRFEGIVAPVAKFLWNFWFLNKIQRAQDFIGLNYYFHKSLSLRGAERRSNLEDGHTTRSPRSPSGLARDDWEKSDMGWELHPEGIYYVLKDLKRYKKPIYITENGIADARDVHRTKFIREHLEWVSKAMAEGVDVRGYFYWSLLDNFEWDKGFWPRFGLVEVDYKTMERRIRQSAFEYKEIIESRMP